MCALSLGVVDPCQQNFGKGSGAGVGGGVAGGNVGGVKGGSYGLKKWIS